MSTDGDSGGWEVFEEETYRLAANQCGGAEYVDRITEPVDYTLSRNPTGFLKIPGYPNLYLAKTKLRIVGPEIIPSFRLWFRIDADRKRVFKEYIEISPPEDMGFADDPFDPDEIPF
jgi:hypothetical protein